MKRLFIAFFAFLFSLFNCLYGEENVNSVIIEYLPAPGQFVNTLPSVTDSASAATLAQQNLEKGSMITLGGFGGFVKAKFEKRVTRVDNQPELFIKGNAYPNGAEPGIVWVSYDANENGIADDVWYELKGSEFENSTRNYSITYYKPSAEDDSSTEEIDNYIFWKDNNNASGWIPKNTYHKQSYFPLWINADSITFHGTLLPDNAVDTKGDGSYYTLEAYEWGYVDNLPSSDRNNNLFDIDNAVDSDGNAVVLPGVDFVMIQTAVNGIHGWIGESSTEVTQICGVQPVGTAVDEIKTISCYVVDKEVVFSESLTCDAYVYSVDGTCFLMAAKGVNSIDLRDFKRGLYIIKIKNTTFKVVI